MSDKKKVDWYKFYSLAILTFMCLWFGLTAKEVLRFQQEGIVCLEEN